MISVASLTYLLFNLTFGQQSPLDSYSCTIFFPFFTNRYNSVQQDFFLKKSLITMTKILKYGGGGGGSIMVSVTLGPLVACLSNPLCTWSLTLGR